MDVSGLVEQGYDDETTSTTSPVSVCDADAVSRWLDWDTAGPVAAA